MSSSQDTFTKYGVRKTTSLYRADAISIMAFVLSLAAGMFWIFANGLTVSGETLEQDMILLIANMMPSLFLLLGGAFLVFVIAEVKKDFSFSSIKEPAISLALGVSFSVAIAMGFIVMNSSRIEFTQITNTYIITQVLLAPTGEEYWRAGIYGMMDRIPVFNDGAPSFVIKAFPSSMIFSLMHFWAYFSTSTGFSLPTFIFTFGMGYGFSMLYWMTKNLSTPLIAHFTWNFLMLNIKTF